MRAIIYARENDSNHNSVVTQLEICKNFADFCEYEIVGIATEIETLFKTDIEYDAVIVTKYNRISRDREEYQKIKQGLLKRGIIIVPAVRS